VTDGASGFTSHEVERAQRVTRESRLLMIAFLVAMALVWTPTIIWLNSWHESHARSVPWWQQLLLYGLVMLGFIETLRAGWPLLRVVVLGRRHDLGQRASATLTRALLVGAVLRLAVALFVVLAVWFFARRSEWGWLSVAPIVLAVNVGLTVGFLRQFRWMYRLRPLDDPRCTAMLGELFGERLEGVSTWVVPSSEIGPQVNGGVGPAGLRRRALFVFDTALALPDDQLRALLAHEVGHLALDHVSRRWAAIGGLSALVAVGALALAPASPIIGAERAAWNEGAYVEAPPGTEVPPGLTFVPVDDPRTDQMAGWLIDVPVRGLPLLVVDFLWLWIVGNSVVAIVVTLRLSRRQEQAADAFALDRTQDPAGFEALIHAMTVASGQQPSNRALSGLGCAHPAPADRIRLAREWTGHLDG
jgi:Zn-dependent protease with chaperone function